MNESFEIFQEFCNSFTHSFPMYSFSTLGFSDVFRGQRKGAVFSETWTNDNNLGKNSLFEPEGYNPVFQMSKNCKGGWSAIFIREDLSISCDNTEPLSIEIINDHSKNIALYFRNTHFKLFFKSKKVPCKQIYNF